MVSLSMTAQGAEEADAFLGAYAKHCSHTLYLATSPPAMSAVLAQHNLVLTRLLGLASSPLVAITAVQHIRSGA